MDCDQLKESYEAYVLGVLEGEDLAELKAHLSRQCPVCSKGVGDARWLVSQLAYMAPPVDPPAAIRRGLLDSVVHKQKRLSWMPAWAWAGIAASLSVVALVSMQQARHFQQQTLELEARLKDLTSETETYRKAFAIASSSASKAITLTTTQPAAPQIRAYWNETLGLLLTAQKMPLPPPNRTYQLWVVPKQGRPISAGIFQPDSNGGVLLLSGPATSIADAAALAITNEPAGGQPQPTTTPIWVGPLS